MSNRPGYKTAGIDKIPEDWKFIRLGEILEEVDLRARNAGNVKDSPILSLTKNLGLIPQEQRFDKRIATRDLSNYKIIRKGWLVYNPYVIWEGAIYFLRNREAGILSPAYVTWKLKKKADYCYLDYLLRMGNVLSTFFSLSTGVVQRRRSIKKEDFLNVLIPFPPFPEQQRISEVLSCVDEAIQKTNEIMGKAEMLKRGLMQRLLTRGIGHARFKQTELGEIPKTWRIERLGKVLSLCQYGLSVKILDEGKYPIIRMNNLESGYVNDDDLRYVNIDDDLFTQYKLDKGDILFNRTNSYELVGKVGIFLLQGDFTFASYLIRLRAKPQLVYPPYLNLYLNLEQTQNKLRSLATRGVSQSNINAKSLRSVKIPIPRINEQEEIASIIELVDHKIQHQKQKKNLLKNLKLGLMQVLLNGKVRVRVA